MTTKNKNIKITADHIEKYFRGDLTPQQMHSLEKAALDDPFLAEAMEGYEAMQGTEWKEQLALAQKQVAFAGTGAKVLPLSKNRMSWWKWAAAAILVIGTGSLLTLYLTKRQQGGNDTAMPIASTEKIQQQPDAVSGKNDSVTAIAANDRPPATSPVKTLAEASDGLNKQQPTTAGKMEDMSAANPLADSSATAANNQAGRTSIGESTISSSAPPALNRQAATGTETLAQAQWSNKAKENPAPVLYENAEAKKGAANTRKEKTSNNYFNAQVVTADNTPLPFSNVLVKSGNFETYADVKGNFRLFTTDSLLTVEIRSVGFQPRSFVLKSNQPMNKIILLENEQSSKARNGDIGRKEQPIRRASVLSDTTTNVEPKDGWKNYNTYVANNIDIPEEALKNEIRGAVELSFDVKPNGSISNIRVNKSPGPAFEEAAKKLIRQGPEWKVKKGKKTSANVTIQF